MIRKVSGICLKELKKSSKDLGQNRPCSDQDTNQAPPDRYNYNDDYNSERFVTDFVSRTHRPKLHDLILS
jgi:hypothetical protein